MDKRHNILFTIAMGIFILIMEPHSPHDWLTCACGALITYSIFSIYFTINPPDDPEQN